MVESVGITTIALGQASPDVELSFPQWRALVVVGSTHDGIRVGEIAGRIGSAVPTTSRLVRRLERRGLVTAERDEADRRATRVRLTPLGEAIRVALVDRRRELVRAALARRAGPLSTDLLTGLAEISEALQRFE
ncbi:MAG TPA: MarR family transcriptional regulator [Candidatus Limnocylindrales bacterium]|nr:MarR family transcriptional regulator [Candidatus Limnocylindrales bacterium]